MNARTAIEPPSDSFTRDLLNREPYLSAILPGTAETDQHRAQLIEELQRLADQTI